MTNKLSKLLNCIVISGFTTLAISVNAQAESFKLVSSRMAKPDPLFPPATIKKYQALKPVTVGYNYELDPDGEPSLSISFSKNETSLQDITNWVNTVGNLKDPVVINNIIKLMPKKLKSNCSYNGTAVVMVKNIELLIPETAGEAEFYSDITKVISISKPKTKCY